MTTPLSGLTANEVMARHANGQGNDYEPPTSRTYLEILAENVFTFINGVFGLISLILISLNRVSDMLVILFIVASSSIVSLVQELRAKRKLDQIALLTRPKATVMRDGQLTVIDPRDIVIGDILLVNPGDQIMVDGAVVGDGRMDVDESLLTGESDLVPKQADDVVYSGSFCVTGQGYYVAQKVGAASMANQLVTGARAFRQIYTPLQQEINLIIRVLLMVATFLWLLTGMAYFIERASLEETVQSSAVIAGLVPAGLYLAITLAYALGAVRIAEQNALIQQANAVESLSNVNVLCLDKTGTLTANRIHVQQITPLAGYNEAEIHHILGDYAASVRGGNRTNEALTEACPGQARQLHDEIPFSSARKWSALVFDDPARRGVYVLGAPDILSLPLAESVSQQIQTDSAQGLRVLLLAYHEAIVSLHDADKQPRLPFALKPIAIISMSDELRHEARETLERFAAIGVDVKIISGDNPHTVAALAKQAGLGADIKVVSGVELALLDDAHFSQMAEKNSIFGRITPEQKARLVQSLRQQGHYVAMIGDGVNDVLSLKQANLGIAMESGSQVTRSVADIILLHDSFAALPHAFAEGQRIRNGIQDMMKLFLVRVFYATLLIIAIGWVSDTFPWLIKHNSVLTFFTVGLPTTLLAFWAKPGQPPRGSLIRSILHFMLPATLSLTLLGLMVYLGYLVLMVNFIPIIEMRHDHLLAIPRTALVTALVWCGLLLLPFLKPPTPAWTGGEPLSGDWRYSYLAIGLFALYGLTIIFSPIGHFFDMARLRPYDYLLLLGVTAMWGLSLRFIWRARLLDRFLGVHLGGYNQDYSE